MVYDLVKAVPCYRVRGLGVSTGVFERQSQMMSVFAASAPMTCQLVAGLGFGFGGLGVEVLRFWGCDLGFGVLGFWVWGRFVCVSGSGQGPLIMGFGVRVRMQCTAYRVWHLEFRV